MRGQSDTKPGEEREREESFSACEVLQNNKRQVRHNTVPGGLVWRSSRAW